MSNLRTQEKFAKQWLSTLQLAEALESVSMVYRHRAAMEARGEAAWKPASRQRAVSQALQAYALLATSADRGAVRDLGQVMPRREA